MTLKTLEGLQVAIQRDLAWRKKELVELRISATQSEESRGYLYRAGLVLLCAHWEGFLRGSIEHYNGHVFAQSLRLRELLPVFVAQAIFADVLKAGQSDSPGSEKTQLRLAKRIQQGLDVVANHSQWKVRTESNPGSGVVTKLLKSVGLNDQLGLDAATWSTTKVFIDEQVVADRHRVAHGDGFPVTKAEFLERSARLISLLDQLAAQVISAAEQRAYRLP